MPVLFVLALLLGACSSQQEPPPAGAEAPPTAEPAGDPTGDPAASSAPDAMPDREKDPVAFWTWRIDRMFIEVDKDKDGLVSLTEFTGNPDEFPKMDTNQDQQLSKDEVSRFVFARYVPLPESPNP